MKLLKNIDPILFLAFFLISPLWAGATKKSFHSEPLFQLSAGAVYSSIDLSRYNSSVTYRGFHTSLVTHVYNVFFLSAEYSVFPVHNSPSAWEDVHTRKFDLNGQISFRTLDKLTHIYSLIGINKHEWKGRRTEFTDLDQLAKGIPEGTYVSVNRWGINVGGGLTHPLYENIGLFADYRFCFGKAYTFEKIKIYDVMATIGINFSIPYPSRGNDKKTFGIGKKIYKWTEKGGK